MILANASGEPIGMVNRGETASQFVDGMNLTLARLKGRTSKAAGTRPTPAPELPLFGGATTRPVPVYSDLVVKSISGVPTRRFALINNETLAVGDAAWIKLGDKRVNVKCEEIREKSVVVRVHGEPGQRELRLSDIRR